MWKCMLLCPQPLHSEYRYSHGNAFYKHHKNQHSIKAKNNKFAPTLTITCGWRRSGTDTSWNPCTEAKHKLTLGGEKNSFAAPGVRTSAGPDIQPPELWPCPQFSSKYNSIGGYTRNAWCSLLETYLPFEHQWKTVLYLHFFKTYDLFNSCACHKQLWQWLEFEWYTNTHTTHTQWYAHTLTCRPHHTFIHVRTHIRTHTHTHKHVHTNSHRAVQNWTERMKSLRLSNLFLPNMS